MTNRKWLLWSLPLVMGDDLPPASASSLHSRSRRKPEREGGGAPRRTLARLAIGLCVLVSICNTQVGFAKTRDTAKKLADRYSLDKRVKETDGLQMRLKLLRLLSRPDIKLFLKVIQKAEGGEPTLMVSGCRAKSLKQHPGITLSRRCRFLIRINGKWKFSTASGNYQLTLSNWKQLAPFLGLQDFSEASQALAALELIRRGGGAAHARTSKGKALKGRIQRGFLNLLQGDVKGALCLATQDWASSSCSSLPGRKLRYVGLLPTIKKVNAGRSETSRNRNALRQLGKQGANKAALARANHAGKIGAQRRSLERD